MGRKLQSLKGNHQKEVEAIIFTAYTKLGLVCFSNTQKPKASEHIGGHKGVASVVRDSLFWAHPNKAQNQGSNLFQET